MKLAARIALRWIFFWLQSDLIRQRTSLARQDYGFAQVDRFGAVVVLAVDPAGMTGIVSVAEIPLISDLFVMLIQKR